MVSQFFKTSDMLRRDRALITAAAFALLYFERSFFLYGLPSKAALVEIVDNVVSVLGGGEPARLLLLETAAAETDMGNAIDRSWFTGIGLMQFDPIGFDDVKERTPARIKKIVNQYFGIDIDRATINDLRWSPMLSVVFARLKYRLIPEPIPKKLISSVPFDIDDPEMIDGRDAYWKRHYNSMAGAGTPEHYVKAAQRNGIA
ncbi:hypothetical protein WCX49_06710 [Sulfurimonas sp. HSL-1656]|uniref:hypothetical protein n=1 Tax=Thiomicrolovo subterrani TaxID=3131934 RepID=UPI0031F98511